MTRLAALIPLLDIVSLFTGKERSDLSTFGSGILSYLGEIDLHQGRTADARKELAESLQIYETLAGQDPDHFTQKLTHLKKLLDELFGDARNPAKAH